MENLLFLLFGQNYKTLFNSYFFNTSIKDRKLPKKHQKDNYIYYKDPAYLYKFNIINMLRCSALFRGKGLNIVDGLIIAANRQVIIIP